MYYKEDYLMRQIKLIIQTIIKLFMKDTSMVDIKNKNESKVLIELDNLLAINQVNKAEDLLFSLKDEGKAYGQEALFFYDRLNEMDDESLLDLNFSRQEIQEGLLDYFDMDKLNIFKE